jgi:hypothetical protein
MILADLFNWLTKLSFEFRNSYQGKVILWVIAIYCLVILACIIKIFLKHPSIWDYTTFGYKRNKGIKKEEKMKSKLAGGSWEKINSKLNSVYPNDWKIAVIEADKLFDETLKKAGIVGETEGERLKNIVEADIGDSLNNVWNAHKIRNKIVHDSEFELTNDLARKAVRTLENAGKELKV